MKRLLVFAGAVLVLAACDNATAPLSRFDGSSAAAKAKTSTAPTSTTIGTGTTMAMEECGLFKHMGDGDSVWVPCEAQ